MIYLNDDALVPEVPIFVKGLSKDKCDETIRNDFPGHKQCYTRHKHTFTVDTVDVENTIVKVIFMVVQDVILIVKLNMFKIMKERHC